MLTTFLEFLSQIWRLTEFCFRAHAILYVYRVSQKFVPLISCAITFDKYFKKCLEDVYCSIEYVYSEVQ